MYTVTAQKGSRSTMVYTVTGRATQEELFEHWKQQYPTQAQQNWAFASETLTNGDTKITVMNT